MDPNEALKELRTYVRTALAYGCTNCYLESLAEKVEALDNWLSRGGFLPDAWASTARFSTYNGTQREIIELDWVDLTDDHEAYTVYVTPLVSDEVED